MIYCWYFGSNFPAKVGKKCGLIYQAFLYSAEPNFLVLSFHIHMLNVIPTHPHCCAGSPADTLAKKLPLPRLALLGEWAHDDG